MEKLIPIVNKLHNLRVAYPDLSIDIPQIIVVGEQSAGKSSVLESLIGRPILPRGTGIVTRCPIVIQLILENVKVKQEIVSQREDEDEDWTVPEVENGVGEWCEFLHKPGKKFTDFDEARQEIQDEVNKRAGTNKGIVMQPLSLAIHSPNVINLTLVDLPGIVENPTGDQPPDIKEQVHKLLNSYMKEENCIILAVSAATSDIATSQSIQMAQRFDAERKRTVAVRTKLDLVDEGTEEEVRKTLTGEVLAFQKGIIGVVNRSQRDINNNRSIQDSLAKEKLFLQQNYPDLEDTHGTPFLLERLQKILIQHIQACLPNLEAKMRDRLEKTQMDLASCGEEDFEDKKSSLQKLVYKFYDDFCKAISLIEGGTIRKMFEKIIPDAIAKIDPIQNLKEAQIQNTIDTKEGALCSKSWPMNTFQALSMIEIGRLHGLELNCATLVLIEFEELVKKMISDKTMERFPELNSAILIVVNSLLTSCHGELESTLKEYVAVQASFADSRNEEFDAKVVETKSTLGQAPHRKYGRYDAQNLARMDQTWTVQQLVNSYVQEVQKEFGKYCKKAVVLKVIDQLKAKLMGVLIQEILQEEILTGLAQESPTITEKRKVSKRRLEGLMEQKKIIEELRNA